MAGIYRVQDPKINQKTLVDEYRTTFKNGQVDNAHSLIDDDVKESITLNSKKINPLLSILTTLQQNYTTNIIDDLANKEAQFQAWIDALQSNLTPWVVNTAYHAYTPVFDSSTSESYLAIQDVPNTGIPLSNTSYWLPLMIKGDDGYVTWGVTYKGSWTSGVNYNKYDMVSYGALAGGTTKMFCATETITGSTTSPDMSSSWQEVLDITRAEINIYQGDLPSLNDLYSRQIFINLPTSGTPATFYRVVGGLNEYITSIGGTATITNDDSESLGTIDATLPVAGSGTYAMRVDASSLISQADWDSAAGGAPFTIKVFVDSEQFNPPLSGSVQLVYGNQNTSGGFTNMGINNHNREPISLDYTNYYYLFTFSKNAGGGAAISNAFVTYFSDDAAPKELAKLNIYTTINQVSMPQLDGTNGFANQTISGVRGGFNNLRNYFNILELP